MRAQPTIAIVGAGYGGLTALGRLRRLLPHARLILVEPAEQHVERARLHRALYGEPVAWQLDECLPAGVRWVRERAIEAHARCVRTAAGTLRADHVVVAAGARPRPSPRGAIPAWDLPGIRTIRAALRDRRRVAVLGGGLTGLEIACALATRCAGTVCRIELVHRGPRLLPDLPEPVRAAVERALQRLHVDVRLNADAPPPGALAIAATGTEPCALPGEGALHVGDADPGNRLRCAQIARLQGLRAAALVARACGVETRPPEVVQLGQLIDLGAAGAAGWLAAGGMRVPLPAGAAALGLRAVALRHRAFLRTLPFTGAA